MQRATGAARLGPAAAPRTTRSQARTRPRRTGSKRSSTRGRRRSPAERARARARRARAPWRGDPEVIGRRDSADERARYEYDTCEHSERVRAIECGHDGERATTAAATVLDARLCEQITTRAARAASGPAATSVAPSRAARGTPDAPPAPPPPGAPACRSLAPSPPACRRVSPFATPSRRR